MAYIDPLTEIEDSLPPFELPLAAQLLLAVGVAVLLTPPAIILGAAVNAYRRWLR